MKKYIVHIFCVVIALTLTCSLIMPSAEAQNAETYNPKNLIAVAGDEQLTISWVNENSENAARIDLFDSSGSRVASSAANAGEGVLVAGDENGRLSLEEGVGNSVLVTGLGNLNSYTYRLRVMYADRTSTEYFVDSGVLRETENISNGLKAGTIQLPFWEYGFEGADYVKVQLNRSEAYDGETALCISSNLTVASGNIFSVLIPKLSKELENGGKYIFSFKAKASDSYGFWYSYGDKAQESDLCKNESAPDFDWKTCSIIFEHNGQTPMIYINSAVEKLYLDDFVLSKINRYNQPEGENYILNASFEYSDADSQPINFMSVARDKLLSVSWVNPPRDDIEKLELFDSEGALMYSSDDELNKESGANNVVLITGLSNGRSYDYKLKITYSDGGVVYDECTSNTLSDEGQLLWGAPMGSQSLLGWSESVYGLPYVKAEIQTETVCDGNGALLIRSNTGQDGISGSYQQFGPKLNTDMQQGKTYRFSYWRKTVNAYPYTLAVNGSRYTYNDYNADWEKVTLPDFVFSGEGDIRFIFDRGAEAIYIDNAELYEVSGGEITGENLLANGNFETADIEIGVFAERIGFLLAECEKRKNNTDYEMSQYMILKYFARYMATDIKNGVDNSQLEYNKKACYDIYQRARQSLQAKMSGEKTAGALPKFVTSPINIEGQSFMADTELDGEISKRPVFFLGWVGYDMLRNNLDDITKFGFNIIQQEIGPSSLLVPADNEKGYSVDISGAQTLLDTLKRAEELNISVNVLVSPHYMPDFIYELYPEIRLTQPGFIKYDVTNPIVSDILEEYLNALIPLIKDSPALHSICLTNEPEFHSVAVKNNPELTARWHEYLKKQYGTIEKLNFAYGFDYSDFSDVEMPQNPKDPAAPNDDRSAIYSDYIMFNYEVFGEFHKFLAQTIKNIAPDVPLHTKMQNPFFSEDYLGVGSGREISYRGNNYEYLAEFCDINGNDSVSNFYPNGGGIKDLEKSFFYDLQRSFKDAPVYNSEEHLQWAGNTSYREEIAIQAYNDLWQGAIHGRSASTMWIWDRTYDPSSTNYNSMLHRPDAMEKIAKAGMDMNRLAEEITLLQQKKSDVAIFYSHYARNYDLSFVSAAMNAYAGAIFSGQKVQFVTDESIEQVYDYPVLIVPHAIAAKDNTAAVIADYMDKGGKVLLIGSGNFKYDEHKVENDEPGSDRYKNVARITAGADKMEAAFSGSSFTSPSQDDYWSLIREWLYENGLNTVLLIDAETKEPVYRTEWQWVFDGDEWLINVSNYQWSDISGVKILINGEEQTLIKDLISGETYDGRVSFFAHTPRLLRTFSKDMTVSDIAFYKDGEAIGRPEGDDVEVRVSVRNMGTRKAEALMAVGVYKDERLVYTTAEEFVIQSGYAEEFTDISLVADFPQEDESYEYKIFIWDTDSGMKPIPFE